MTESMFTVDELAASVPPEAREGEEFSLLLDLGDLWDSAPRSVWQATFNMRRAQGIPSRLNLPHPGHYPPQQTGRQRFAPRNAPTRPRSSGEKSSGFLNHVRRFESSRGHGCDVAGHRARLSRDIVPFQGVCCGW